MADEPKAEQLEETKTPTEPMPSSENKSVDSGEATQPAARDSEVVDALDAELPDNASQRTAEQFEKLKRQLAEERERRTRLEMSFNQPKPKQGERKLPDWYDPKTGEVDVTKLQERESHLESQIQDLQRQVRGVSQMSEAQQEKEAYEAYSDLNPKADNFDPDFQEQVISYMATQFAKGNNPTLKQAADKVMSIANKRAGIAEQTGAKKALEQITPKEQASLEATGRSDRRLPSQDLENLRQATRYGGRAGLEAAMARLQGAPRKK